MITRSSFGILLGFLIIMPLFVDRVECIVNWNENNTAVACDFTGNDLAYVQTSLSQCSLDCYNSPGCTHYTWTPYGNGNCWLKMGPVSRADAQSTTDENRVCGIIDRSGNHALLTSTETVNTIQWNESNWATGCDFYNNDLYNYQTSVQNCADLCVRIAGCTHFTWTTYNNDTCWMKKGNVSRNDAFASNDQTMICGIVNSTLKKSQIPANKGTVSAFWDCCKSTCPWPIKTNDTQTSKICDRDDVTVLDGDTIVGCNNGTTHRCLNRMPWSVSSQLSYGFAAATIAVCPFLFIILKK